MASHLDFDHVALGVRAAQPYLDLMVGEMGGKLREGGTGVGFRALQVTLGAMHVELLQPHDTERSDFLARFLDRHGEGPHHLTFKVPDLAAEIERLRALGLDPVQIDLANPWWKECFLLPHEAHGTVVQIAQSSLDDPEVRKALAGLPDPWQRQWWDDPPDPAGEQVRLLRVVLGSPAPQSTIDFLTGVLGGTADGLEVGWPGGGRLAVEQRGGRPGVERLEVDRGPARTIGGARFEPAPG